ncbi:hypothetical protein B0T13DRAFT_451156 [Neurospora crassa]|nr:hypothetical protein B0T13DRAFT_451156 [Neurospora crassa]
MTRGNDGPFTSEGNDLGLNNVPGIIHHAQESPCWLLWLGNFGRIRAADCDALGSEELRNVNVEVPVDPSREPVSMSKGWIEELASGVEPVVISVEGDFDSLDLPITAIVCEFRDTAQCRSKLWSCPGLAWRRPN